MATKVICEDDTVTALLSGEIDHHNAPAVRAIIDTYIDKAQPKKLILDFGGVSFMDSSGIGLVMGRYKNVFSYGGKIEIVNLSHHAYKVMKLSGIEKIAVIKKKKNEEEKSHAYAE